MHSFIRSTLTFRNLCDTSGFFIAFDAYFFASSLKHFETLLLAYLFSNKSMALSHREIQDGVLFASDRSSFFPRLLSK